MLSKEECLKKAKELSYGWHIGNNEFVPLKDVNKLIREIYSIKPYKFEDLKECDYVYDKKEKEIVLIMETSENHKTNEKFVYTLVMGCEDLNKVPFKENRFFPITKALQYLGKEDEE